jgi:plastocyanin
MKGIIWILTILAFPFILVTTGSATDEKFIVPVDEDGIQRVEMLAGSYYYKPKNLVVKKDIAVEILISKEAGMAPHNFVLASPDAAIDISEELSGESKRITFTPKKAGIFKFYCTKRFLFFQSHRDHGMEGTLEVLE